MPTMGKTDHCEESAETRETRGTASLREGELNGRYRWAAVMDVLDTG